MTETGEPDWAQIRAEYEAGEVPVRDIAAARGVTIDMINHRRVREIWRPRRLWARKGQRRVMVSKLMHLLEKQIAQLEKKLESNEVFDMADTKILDTMTRTFEKSSGNCRTPRTRPRRAGHRGSTRNWKRCVPS